MVGASDVPLSDGFNWSGEAKNWLNTGSCAQTDKDVSKNAHIVTIFFKSVIKLGLMPTLLSSESFYFNEVIIQNDVQK